VAIDILCPGSTCPLLSWHCQMDTTFKESAFTPKYGKVKPIDIFSAERRKINEKAVTNLEKALARDGSFFNPILVRDEGATGYRLVAGHHRVEASRRCFGEEAPISAIIYPEDTPDPLIEVLEIEENLFRKELTAAECQVQTIRWVAACKKLVGNKLETELPVSDAKSVAGGGRGKKAWTAKAAGKLGLSKTAVQKRINAAEAAIGEKIDLDRDTPEELERKAADLERKADKRQHVEPKTERPKHRERAPQEVVEHEQFDSGIEEVWKALSALDWNAQAKIILRACRSHGWGLRIGPRWRVSAVDEEPAVALPPKSAPATYDTAVDSQPEQQEGGADASADDLQHPGDAVSQAAD
jgi:ParB-like nuclease domain